MTNNRGSVLIESGTIMLVLVVVMMVGFSRVSLIAAKAWLNRSLYEGLRCELHVAGSRESCQHEMRRNVALLAWGRVDRVMISSTYNLRLNKTAQGEILWCNSKRESVCDNKNKLTVKGELRESAMKVMR